MDDLRRSAAAVTVILRRSWSAACQRELFAKFPLHRLELEPEVLRRVRAAALRTRSRGAVLDAGLERDVFGRLRDAVTALDEVPVVSVELHQRPITVVIHRSPPARYNPRFKKNLQGNNAAAIR